MSSGARIAQKLVTVPFFQLLKSKTREQCQIALQWAKSVGYHKQNLKRLKVQISRMKRRQSFTEIKWIVPENSPDPPVELKRLFIQAAEPPRQEETQRGPYTDDDVDFILTSIRFGKQLTEDELKEIKAVVKARIAAFSRDDAEMGYTTLIECEIDPLDKTPVQIRPYKLAFEEQREAAKIIEQLLKEKAIARSHSDWAAPAFLVPKPNGGWRLVTDLRFIKSKMPRLEDAASSYRGCLSEAGRLGALLRYGHHEGLLECAHLSRVA